MINLKYIVVTLCVTTFSFAQEPQKEQVKKEQLKEVPMQTYELPNQVKPENKLSLQKYVEELYINSCRLYHKGAMPTVESGEFNVLLIDKKNDCNSFIKSADLATLTIEEVKEIRYEKSKQTDVMYGTKGGAFGVVVITKQ
ncbi:MAG: hypothetical protein LBI72_12955 [Flavobacteriaceae bacterium]|jgi:hypothetical protein|nr:hypothetical protein [Flavobacteriaceae bacterium]